MPRKKKDMVNVYTDGACSGNPGPGGWGAIIEVDEKSYELWGGEKETTNNRMELLGAIKALKKVTKTTLPITLYSDSQYLVTGMTEWMSGWKEKNWKTAGRKPVKNFDLWQELDRLNTKLDITWKWVRGHSNHKQNERCDMLAREAIKKLMEQ